MNDALFDSADSMSALRTIFLKICNPYKKTDSEKKQITIEVINKSASTAR